MKKILILIMTCVTFHCFSQSNQRDSYYYHKGEKLDLIVDQKQLNLVALPGFQNSDISDIDIQINNSATTDIITQKKIIKVNFNTSPNNATYNQTINELKSKTNIITVAPFYVVNDSVSVGTSHIFFVKLKQLSDTTILKQISNQYGVQILKQDTYMPLWYHLAITRNSGYNAVAMSNIFYETGRFDEIDPNFQFTIKESCSNEPEFNRQWNLYNSSNTDYDINICDAWEISRGKNVNIAIFDQGLYREHRDLSDNIHPSLSYNTYIGDNSDGFVLDENIPYCGNHGNFVAGIAAAAENNFGIVGVAPESKLISISFRLDDLNFISNFANGFNWAATNDVDVINCSWGIEGIDCNSNLSSSLLEDAIDNALTNGRNGKGCIIVFAAGNDPNHGYYGYKNVAYPGCSDQRIIVVGNIMPDGYRHPSSNFGTTLDVVAPGTAIFSTIVQLETYETVLHASFGTSFSAPHVAGIAALLLSENPNLTMTEVSNIIESTCQKVHIEEIPEGSVPLEITGYIYSNNSNHPNGSWNSEMGYGLVDAYAAVQKARGIDLYTRDNESDTGVEPNIAENVKNSPDIWLRKYANTGNGHQSGLNGGINHVYIRINNRGEGSLGTDTVELYTRKAGLGAFFWNSGWTKVGTACIPSIQTGNSATVHMSAIFPNYSRFPLFFDSPNMDYALLTRIKSDIDTMTYNEELITMLNVHKNNNISYKNVTISDAVILDDDVVTDVVVTALDNPTNDIFYTTLKFTSPSNEVGDPLFKEAEIRLVFPKDLVQSWGSNYTLSGAKKVNDSTFLITGSTAKMENISIPANYNGYMMAQVNFLTQEYSEKDKYEYIVEQTDPTTGQYQNGLVMIVDKTLRSNLFAAEGGENIIANANVPVNLSATAIGEDAVYNWYDASGVLVNSGQNIAVTSSQTQKYTLEVTAKADGYKDYDSVYVIRTLGNIVSISPNPTSGHAVVTYNLTSGVSAASIVVTNSSGLAVYSSAINVSATTHTLNLQNLVAGQYSLRLVSSTGEVLDTKTLIVQ